MPGLNDRGHISSLVLERLIAGESAAPCGNEAPEVVSARFHCEQCPDCQARLAELRADCGVFDSSVLPRTLPRFCVAAPRPALRLWLPLALLGTAGAASALFAIIPSLDRSSPPTPSVQAKGGAALRVYAARRGIAFGPSDHQPVRPGDRLQVVITVAAAAHLVLLGQDGTGAVTGYFPSGSWGDKQPLKLAAGENELPASIEIDEAPGPERLIAILTPERFSPERALRTLERGGLEALREDVGNDGELLTVSLPKVVP